MVTGSASEGGASALDEPLRAGSHSDPIRVLHCIWHGGIGGAERSLYQLVRAQMSDPEISPGLLFAQGGGPYWQRAQELGCFVATLDLPSGRSLTAIPRAAAVMRHFSVHHFHSAEPGLMIGSARCPDVGRVYTHRAGKTDYPLRKRVRYKLTGLILRRYFQGFSGNTRHAVSSAAELLSIAPERFAVTYNGLEFTHLEPTRRAADVRAELGLGPDDFVLGTAANLRPWKRIERLLEVARLPKRPTLRVLVLGDGPDMPRLQAIARDLDVQSRVVFAGMRTHVGDDLQVMDAFCLPSNGLESFGNAAVEAMAVGIPTIVFSDSPGLTEHILPGRTGFVVRDQMELRDQLATLVENRELGRSIGAAGRAAVRERYRMSGAVREYKRLYRSLMLTG
jgi:glycosyltransferase involved in cell wall biosynthesis